MCIRDRYKFVQFSQKESVEILEDCLNNPRYYNNTFENKKYDENFKFYSLVLNDLAEVPKNINFDVTQMTNFYSRYFLSDLRNEIGSSSNVDKNCKKVSNTQCYEWYNFQKNADKVIKEYQVKVSGMNALFSGKSSSLLLNWFENKNESQQVEVIVALKTIAHNQFYKYAEENDPYDYYSRETAFEFTHITDLIFIFLAKTDIYKADIFANVVPKLKYDNSGNRFERCQQARLSDNPKGIKENCEDVLANIIRKY